MGTAESSPSSDVGGATGLTSQSSFHRQSPNIARLIRSENSSKMEYEFPIADVPSTSSSHHHHNAGISIGKHALTHGNTNRSSTSSMYHTNSPTSDQSGGYQLGYNDHVMHSKLPSNSASNLWLSLTSCFGCRMRSSTHSNMNPLRDKVHAIRIVRASNDLTPAVFDSHYNIITLEQLRECDNTVNGNSASLANDPSNPLSSSTSTGAYAQNGNGSVVTSTGGASSKKDTSHRMRKKKKKRSSATGKKSMTGSDDDDDDDERSGRT
jgi:hypothetical protein